MLSQSQKEFTPGAAGSTASRDKAPTSHMAGTVSLHRRLKELERQREREALQRIERLLPAAFTSSAQQNSAGKRSVGAFGRSQINILSDLVRYVSSVKHRGVVSDASVREALLCGQNLLVLEVDSAPGLTVRAASAGASEFFKHSPYGSSLVGRSIASLLHDDDVPVLERLCVEVEKAERAKTALSGGGQPGTAAGGPWIRAPDPRPQDAGKRPQPAGAQHIKRTNALRIARFYVDSPQAADAVAPAPARGDEPTHGAIAPRVQYVLLDFHLVAAPALAGADELEHGLPACKVPDSPTARLMIPSSAQESGRRDDEGPGSEGCREAQGQQRGSILLMAELCGATQPSHRCAELRLATVGAAADGRRPASSTAKLAGSAQASAPKQGSDKNSRLSSKARNRALKAALSLVAQSDKELQEWPECTVCGDKLQTLLIKNWSSLWTVRQLENHILYPSQGREISVSQDGTKAFLRFFTPAGAMQARTLCEDLCFQVQQAIEKKRKEACQQAREDVATASKDRTDAADGSEPDAGSETRPNKKHQQHPPGSTCSVAGAAGSRE